MEGMKLSTLYAAFLKEKMASRGWSVATKNAYESDGRILLAFLGSDDIRTLTPKRVEAYPLWLSERVVPRGSASGHASSSVTRRITSACVFCDWLVRRGDLILNPFKGMDKPKREKALPRALHPATVERLLALETLSIQEKAVIAVMRYCGLRVSEVENLDLENIDLTAEVVRVWGKGNKERVVPLFADLMPHLTAWLAMRGDHPGPLFKGQKGRYSRKCVERMLTRACDAAGVPRFTSHCLRHTFATELLRQVHDVRVLQVLLGHENLDTTAMYLKVTSEDLRRAKEIMDKVSKVTGQPQAIPGGGEHRKYA